MVITAGRCITTDISRRSIHRPISFWPFRTSRLTPEIYLRDLGEHFKLTAYSYPSRGQVVYSYLRFYFNWMFEHFSENVWRSLECRDRPVIPSHLCSFALQGPKSRSWSPKSRERGNRICRKVSASVNEPCFTPFSSYGSAVEPVCSQAQLYVTMVTCHHHFRKWWCLSPPLFQSGICSFQAILSIFFLLPQAFGGLKYAENAIAAGAPTTLPQTL